MQAAFESLKTAVERGSLAGVAAGFAAIWAAYWHHADAALLGIIFIGFGFGVIDTGLGFAVAWSKREVRAAAMRRTFGKIVAYTSAMFLSAGLGYASDLLMGTPDGRLAFILPTGVGAMLLATEAISSLEHIATMTDGRLSLKPLRAIAERLAQTAQGDPAPGDADA